ncbi:carbohydrate ABC transporter permease [Clavibacter sp. km1a]|uniref:carbohydrate ABC transporter permease n=1 Tax=Clavibacter sp. km1a TaxID=3459136 RepID=UPI00404177D5
MTTATRPAPVGAQPRSRSAAIAREGRTEKPRFDLAKVVALIVLVVMSAVWLLPFLWAVLTSFKSETDAAASPVTIFPAGGFTLDAYASVLNGGSIPLWTWNSLITSIVITVVSIVFSALAGYALSRIDFRGKKLLMGAIIASIIIPPQILIVPLFYQMLSFDLIDTLWAVILPQIVQPAMVFILKKFFDQIPIELEDAARVDGANRVRVFLQIVLPLSRPILSAVSIFVFIGAWNNFLWPFIATNDASLMTLPVGLQTVKSAYGIQYAQNMASAVLAALPLIIVFLFFQRQIIKGISTTGFGGQ